MLLSASNKHLWLLHSPQRLEDGHKGWKTHTAQTPAIISTRKQLSPPLGPLTQGSVLFLSSWLPKSAHERKAPDLCGQSTLTRSHHTQLHRGASEQVCWVGRAGSGAALSGCCLSCYQTVPPGTLRVGTAKVLHGRMPRVWERGHS